MWTPYEIIRKHKHDFVVKYRLYSKAEGGREVTYQGLRCDFMYAGDDIKDGLYMIHPEFEDRNREVIINDDTPLELVGTCRMWVVFPEIRELIHKKRVKIGAKGFMMEGSWKIGEVEVIEIASLFENPVQD